MLPCGKWYFFQKWYFALQSGIPLRGALYFSERKNVEVCDFVAILYGKMITKTYMRNERNEEFKEWCSEGEGVYKKVND